MSNAEERRNESLERIIQEQLNRLLSPVSVISVMVEDAVDEYDDPYLEVRAIYRPSDCIPETLSVVRHLRPVLAEHGEDRFPVISYVAEDEAGIYTEAA